MSIEFRCDGCGKAYKVGDALAGKKARCKACGAVMVVPAAAAAGASPRTSGATGIAGARPVAKPATIGVAGAASIDDPFENFNAMAAIEDTAAVEESPPIARAHVSRRAATGPYDPYVNIGGEQAIDRFVPWAPVGIFVIFLFMLLVRGISHVNEVATKLNAPDANRARAIGMVCGIAIGMAIGVAAISAPLCLLGVFIA